MTPRGPSGTGANAVAVGRHNRDLVIAAIRAVPGVSRREVADQLGLTPAAVSNIVQALRREGLVEEAGQTLSSGGKPGARLWLRPGARFAVGAHLDREEIAVAVVDLAGTILWSETAVEPASSPEAFLAVVAEHIRQAATAAAGPGRHLAGVGVSCPGPLTTARDVLVNPPNLPGWRNVPLGAILGSSLGDLGPITIERDANAAALGEQWAGGAGGFADFLFVYLGTGVGAGLVLDRRLYRGISGGAGSLGHVIVDRGGRVCACGARGCLETVASQGGMLEVAAELPARWRSRLGLSAGDQRIDEDYRLLAAAADGGDERAGAIFADAADALGTAMVSMANLLDLDAMILGGRGFWPQQERFLDAVRQAVRTRPINPAAHNIDVRPATLGSLSAAVGAAVLALSGTVGPVVA
ncbi:MAG TPA: ROK family transcriptional regulator [Acidimicrobiales bacterium]|nr:ROK family transcriptional regulator [Acidimicrobiales bacterium]